MSYKFSHVEDPNDPAALRKAVERIELGKPASLGGRLREASNISRTFDIFTIHTPPDVTQNTRIIAVLGILQNDAALHLNGWFLSDFIAFHHLLRRCTKSQKWLHCLDLASLIRQHTRYLHGSPFLERKVVLNDERLECAQNAKDGHVLTEVKPANLRLDFKKEVRAQCSQAAKAEPPENVLILIFGHGELKKKGIEIGSGRALEPAHLQSEMKGTNAKVTLLTTACYSGGWTCYPQFNISLMAAAGEKNVSRSWAKSGSSGRACGSMYTSAIIDKLIYNSATGRSVIDQRDEDDEEKPLTEQQEETYTAFASSVYYSLLNGIDRRGMEHQFSFGAQDDAWGMCWRERTGIPLDHYKNRWDELQDWPKDQTLHPGDPQNRNPNVTREEEAEWAELKAQDKGKNVWDPSKMHHRYEAVGSTTGTILGKRKTSGLYGGTDTGLEHVVRSLGKQYLDSYKGNDDTGNDGGLHGLLFAIFAGKERDPLRLEEAHQALQYRMEQMTKADEYLEIMDIPPPKGKACHEYDTNKVQAEVGSAFSAMIELVIDREIIFPDPIRSQGRPFYKGDYYLVAAFHHAKASKKVMIEKLDALAARLHQEVEDWKEVSKQAPGLTSKRQKLFTSLGVALGNMSPTKRQSRGMSVIEGA